MNSTDMALGVSAISEENIRQKVICVGDFFVLADFYNASPESVKAALESLIKLPAYQRKSILLGDILELGEQSESIHKSLGEEIAKYNFYNLYLFGKCSKNIYEGAICGGFPQKRIFINEDLDDPSITARQIIHNHTRGEIILMKASRGIRLERILQEIEAQGN